jgi:hypothetical protein
MTRIGMLVLIIGPMPPFLRSLGAFAHTSCRVLCIFTSVATVQGSEKAALTLFLGEMYNLAF